MIRPEIGMRVRCIKHSIHVGKVGQIIDINEMTIQQNPMERWLVCVKFEGDVLLRELYWKRFAPFSGDPLSQAIYEYTSRELGPNPS